MGFIWGLKDIRKQTPEARGVSGVQIKRKSRRNAM
jgi:hypothetical protein